MLTDIAGEIANTLSGNARAELGEEFIFSILKVFKGQSALEAISTNENLCDSCQMARSEGLSRHHSILSLLMIGSRSLSVNIRIYRD